jgi:hypothetical protein
MRVAERKTAGERQVAASSAAVKQSGSFPAAELAWRNQNLPVAGSAAQPTLRKKRSRAQGKPLALGRTGWTSISPQKRVPQYLEHDMAILTANAPSSPTTAAFLH